MEVHLEEEWGNMSILTDAAHRVSENLVLENHFLTDVITVYVKQIERERCCILFQYNYLTFYSSEHEMITKQNHVSV